MKHIFICLILSTTSLINAVAQDSLQIKKPTIGFHFFYNDFKTAQLINSASLSNVLKNKLWTKPSNMQGGFGIDYIQGLNKNLDFIGSVNGSWVDYLLPGNTLFGSSNLLLDFNTGVHLKMFSDKHTFSPFLIAKADYSTYKNLHGFSIAPGAGLQMNIFKDIFILATIEYRSALSQNLSNQLYYSVGIATNIGIKRSRPVKSIPLTPAPQPVKKEVELSTKDLIVTVTDEATGQPLPYVAVELTEADAKKRFGSTDDYGRVTFSGLNPAGYTVSGTLNKINATSETIHKDNFSGNENQLNITLTHNDPRFTLYGVVINKTKNIPEGDANVMVTNESDLSVITVQSKPGDGVFRTQLISGTDFILVGKKANYISNIEKITTKGLNRSTTLYVKLELGIEEARAGQSIQLSSIYFEVGKANLNTAVSSDLDKLIQFMKDNPETRLEIQGHTDNKGSATMNNSLSQSRANSVVEYLVKNGINENRLKAKGYGSALPLADNITLEGRAKNRRVVMKILQ